MTRFVPAADEVGRLQRGRDPECLLFQTIAEQGHYAGRTMPSATRQGTYAITPSGRLLVSWNNNNPEFVAARLREALEKWEQLTPEERAGAPLDESELARVRRPDQSYPENGLVLRVISRDLPRPVPIENRWANAWNTDYAWFTREETEQFLPGEAQTGRTYSVPATPVQRLARLHLVDNVRGETSAYPEDAVKEAVLHATVSAVDGPVVSVELEGRSRTVQKGSWPIRGFRDMNAPASQERGIETRWRGQARFDREQNRFLEFELLALGTRHGGTQYNGRGNDLEPAPIGFLLSLAGDAPAERVAPAFFRHYGWR